MNISSLFAESDKEKRHTELSKSLKEFETILDWEIFRDELESMYKSENGKGGRKPYDPVMMLKLLFLQRLYDLSDDEMEFQLLDRLSFQKFLGLGKHDRIPDAKTIWVFRERLKEEKLDRILFTKLDYWIKRKGGLVRSGSIIDASFVSAPVQHNSAEENETLKKGGIPEDWEKEENKNMFSQKDTDARWTKKHNKSYYGYKHHIAADDGTKLIEDYSVTDASVHDSQTAPDLISEIPEGSALKADSAYVGPDVEVAAAVRRLTLDVCRKAARNRPLTEEDKAYNRTVSKTRARVEHVFADIRSFGGDFVRTVGMARAEVHVFLVSFTYNLRRFRFLSLKTV